MAASMRRRVCWKPMDVVLSGVGVVVVVVVMMMAMGGVDATEEEKEEKTQEWGPILGAVMTGSAEMLKSTLEELEQRNDSVELYINEKEEETGNTPLMFSCLHGFSEMTEILLTHGADRSIGEKDGFTCLHAAAVRLPPSCIIHHSHISGCLHDCVLALRMCVCMCVCVCVCVCI